MVGFINFLNAMGGRTELGKGHEELGDFGLYYLIRPGRRSWYTLVNRWLLGGELQIKVPLKCRHTGPQLGLGYGNC